MSFVIENINSSKLTEMENKVFNAIAWGAYSEGGVDTQDIAIETKLKMNSIKGVAGSLVKKGLVNAEEDTVNGTKRLIFMPIFKNKEYNDTWFGWDYFTEVQWAESMLETLENL